ncbi:hypothetical protein IFM89_022765 [Coptis chinensis]|uniref:Uncharacterized protein n=1 Tax=Coptis chinensis TaxID=261450 RepID=A0A835ITX4_9MAGN|nr:hypothetical protein IFM89_022765 [Coptis chinensis]
MAASRSINVGRRGPNFSLEEDEALCKAWVAIGEDSVVGICQTGKRFDVIDGSDCLRDSGVNGSVELTSHADKKYSLPELGIWRVETKEVQGASTCLVKLSAWSRMRHNLHFELPPQFKKKKEVKKVESESKVVDFVKVGDGKNKKEFPGLKLEGDEGQQGGV